MSIYTLASEIDLIWLCISDWLHNRRGRQWNLSHLQDRDESSVRYVTGCKHYLFSLSWSSLIDRLVFSGAAEGRIEESVKSWNKFCVLTDILEYSLNEIADLLPRYSMMTLKIIFQFKLLYCTFHLQWKVHRFQCSRAHISYSSNIRREHTTREPREANP